ncbi:MAG: hypothetical protein H0U77_14865 [Nocardioidaceae bacterium]|nr:hypothetical protein [Nocardioidaceae bacterium]
MSSDQEPFWRGRRGKMLVASLAGLITFGIVLGLVIAWASTTVLDAAGFDDQETPPTLGAGPSTPEPSDSEPPATSESPVADSPSSSADPAAPTLSASPTQVASYEEITLTGRFPGLPAGAPLQIERKEGGLWALFPVGLSTSELGTFSTFVQTGQPGQNLFRVTDPGTGLSTPVVTVSVG